MALDLFIGVPILVFILLGFRDGVVRKIVSLGIMLIALYLSQIYRQDMGNLLIEYKLASPVSAPIRGFLAIFFGICILQTLLYRIVAKGYKIGGFVDRIAGSIVGLIQGIVFMSSLLMMLSLSGIPSRATAKSSQFYHSVVNIAPQFLDFTGSVGTETIEKLKDVTSPGSEADSTITNKKIQFQKANSQLDSLRNYGRKFRNK